MHAIKYLSKIWHRCGYLNKLKMTRFDSTPVFQNNFGPRKSNLHPFFKNTYIYFLDTLFFASFLCYQNCGCRPAIWIINITIWYLSSILQKTAGKGNINFKFLLNIFFKKNGFTKKSPDVSVRDRGPFFSMSSI